MKRKTAQQNGLTQDVYFSPSLDAAIAAWDAVRKRFQTQRCKEHQDAYVKATDELGQSISLWALSNPALAEQFALWFDSHPD
jgi:hypothetical protein